jgi:hypothetical protein
MLMVYWVNIVFTFNIRIVMAISVGKDSSMRPFAHLAEDR